MLRKGLVFLMVLFCCGAALADGGIRLNRTRLIFDAADKMATLRVSNTGEGVYLIQARLTKDVVGKDVKGIPFMVTPPLFRLNENSANVMRIAPVSPLQQLPKDRESLFYFHMSAIPSQKRPNQSALKPAVEAASISFSLEDVIKVFYRPSHLNMSVRDSYHLIKFHQKGNQLIIDNPTPYYKTLYQLKLDGVVQKLNTPESSMIAPFNSLTLPVTKKVKNIEWVLIKDAGDATEPEKLKIA